MEKLFISFSGGKTSGFMTKYITDNYSHEFDIVTIFANTGEEMEETLQFVNRCDVEWGLNVVWVEARVNHNTRKSCSHKVVNFETASRNGEPFEEVIRKYGISNQTWPHCTRELKLNPMTSYMRSIGWGKGKYKVAIGIRSDESKRVNKKASLSGIVYPLIDWIEIDKIDVNDWWEAQDFNLGIQEHQGNCKWCWKKSTKKHLMLIDETPDIFDFPRRMEELHGYSGMNKDGEKRVFFRNHMNTDGLFNLSKEINIENGRQLTFDLDENGGCSESCDINEELINSL